jgi:hypothetical protein
MRVNQLGSPERPEIDDRVTRLPAREEALDRRVQGDAGELVDTEEPMAANRGVPGRDRLERTAAQVAGEDDMHDVLRGRSLRRDRVRDRHRSLERESRLDAHLLRELAPQGVDETLAGVHASAG